MTKYIAPIASGSTNSLEKNDCTVRALSNAAGLSYEIAHETLRVYAGRVARKSSTVSELTKAYQHAGAKNITFCGKYRKWYAKDVEQSSVSDKGMSIKTFIANNPVGKFVVVVTGHAVCVADGQLVDTTLVASGKRVVATYDFTSASRINAALKDIE
jgi:hypothetical protein